VTAIDRVIDKLDNVKQNGPESWIGSCPVPEHGQGRGDRNPSLSVKYQNGQVLLHCMSGCHIQDVVLALGMDWPDLWDEPFRKPVTIASWQYHKRDGSPYFTVERQQTATGKRYVQRVEGRDRLGFPANFQPSLYRLPQVLAQAGRGGEVYVVEGEKCVHAAERLGLVATCGPNGAKAWKPYYPAWLQGCSLVTVVVDNDDAGMQYAAEVCVSLRGKNIPVRTVKVAVNQPKADLYDHVLAGYGVDDLIPIKVNRLRPEGSTCEVLLRNVYPPVSWAVRGLLPAGFALLGGPPKAHKSFMALDLAVGVAVGGFAMRYLNCEQGSVLYLSLDNDSERRLQWRLRRILNDDGGLYATIPVEFHTEWPTGAAAICAAQEWVDDETEAGRKPRLVVADTLARVEPNFEGTSFDNSYLTATSVLSAWSRFAGDNDLTVLAVHHDRKASSEDTDWMSRFIGSRGLTAVAQTLLFIEHQRGGNDGVLHVAGRDVGTADYPMTLGGPWWRFTDQAGADLDAEAAHNDLARPRLSVVD